MNDGDTGESPRSTLTLGQVVPGLVGGVQWSNRHAALLRLGEAWIQGVLVELGELLQRNSSRDGLEGGKHSWEVGVRGRRGVRGQSLLELEGRGSWRFWLRLGGRKWHLCLTRRTGALRGEVVWRFGQREGGRWDLRGVGGLMQLVRGAGSIGGREKTLQLGHRSLGRRARRGDAWRRVRLRVGLRLVLRVGETGLGGDLRRQGLVLWNHSVGLLLDRGLDRALGLSLSFGSRALGGLRGDRGRANICQKDRTGRCIRLD